MEDLETKLASLFWIATSIMAAPLKTQRPGKWHEIVIGIGNDHTAYVTIDDDALVELCKRNGMSIKDLSFGSDKVRSKE